MRVVRPAAQAEPIAAAWAGVDVESGSAVPDAAQVQDNH